MAKELLKEAIADAKAVREVALENAKSALEEAFTPKIKSMLSAKISEEIEDTQEGMEYESTENDVYSEGELDEDEDNLEEDLDLDEDFNLEEDEEDGEEGVGDLEDDMGTEMTGPAESTSMDEEIDLEEILNELEALEEEDGVTIEEEGIDEEVDVDALLEELNIGNEMDEEVDLTEIDMLNEVEPISTVALILAAWASMAGGAVAIEKAKAQNPGLKKALDAVGKSAGAVAGKQGTRQESVKGSINEEPISTIAMILAAWASMAGGAVAIEKAKKENPGLKKALDAAGSAAGAVAGKQGTRQESDVTEAHPGPHDYQAEDVGRGNLYKSEDVYEMKKELREAHRANKYLKSQISEINLLNSKLLYTNKIFKSFSLNDSQKLRVVEALDNAENVKEAKLVFNTLKESFIVSKPKRSIKEGLGLASKAAGKSTANKAVITESNEMIDRFQKLANINN